MILDLWPLLVAGLVVVGAILHSVTYVYDYQYGLRFRLGRFVGQVDSGLRLRIPLVDRIRTYSRRVVTVEVPPQSAMTRDNVSLEISAVVYFRVHEPEQTVLTVEDHEYAVAQLAQSTMRSTVGASELDEVLGNRESLAAEIATTVDEVAGDWGIDVVGVELQEIEIPEKMQRVIAAQAEADREKRARSRLAEAEEEAAERLVNAADHLADSPGAMRLRLFQNLKEVAMESNSSVVAPIPVSLLQGLGVLDRATPDQWDATRADTRTESKQHNSEEGIDTEGASETDTE